MRSQEIRERFLRFFEDRGHHRLPSASLIPDDDPSLLFTVAGMVPLKPYISGERQPPNPRLTSCQKCFRGSGLTTDDIASVGDSSHNTFFEMLGNWSIGDYFKEGAIDLAWDLLTQEFGLDPDRLWPSIYPDDTASLELWANRIGIPESRISRFTDNWWQAGPTGPCGYDSEVRWDHGPPCSCGRADCRPEDECGGDRWIEIWNLVFMEFNRAEDGTLIPLPKKTVDTGMGLERVVSVLQGVRSIYETDLFAGIVAGFQARAGGGPASPADTVALNVLADHVRGAAFLIAEGVRPGNEGRGYVLRRVIRRAAIHGRRIGLRGGLAPGVPQVVAVMGEAYPELREHQRLIEQTLQDEEANFARTLEAAAERVEALLTSGAPAISGDDAFRLYDTFGLPVELTVEMAAERGISVDLTGFAAALEVQRGRSRGALSASGRASGGGWGTVTMPPTTFLGYDTLEADVSVVHIGSSERETLAAGEEDTIFLDASPFYAEAGGQVGDTGTLSWEAGLAQVTDTTRAGEAWAHRVRVEKGALRRGQHVRAAVDPARRAQIARHHSATHLLHRALRDLLGEAVVQRGSYVGPDHATFDFSFPRGLTVDESRTIEQRINSAIRDNLQRDVAVMPVAEAKATGAVALFGERYGERVRVVDFGGWARELCGGTHVQRSGDVGAAIVISDRSIGQGIRRVEMVVGEAAVRQWEESQSVLHEAATILKARPAEVPQRISQLIEQNRDLRRRPQAREAGTGVDAALAQAQVTAADGFTIALVDAATLTGDEVAGVTDRLFAERLNGDGVAVVLGAEAIAVKVGGAALAAGVDAGALVRAAAASTGGGGGGRPEFARGGLKDAGRRGRALDALRTGLEGGAP